MLDQFSLNFTANVSLTFTATSALQKNKSTNVSHGSRMTVVTVIKGQGTDAQAVGTISFTANGAHPAIPNIVPMPSIEGIIQNAENSSITIIRPK